MYYTKEEIKKYVEKNNKRIIESGLKPLTPIEEPVSQLANEEDIVRFWFFDYNEHLRIEMGGKTFIRIVHDLYTDDMFAIDMYQASQDGITIEEAIKQRKRKRKESERALSQEEKEKLYKVFEKRIKNKTK